MKIIIDAPDFEAEDNVAIAQLLFSLCGRFENMDSEEKVVSCTINETVLIDDWELHVRVTLDLED